ncbi:MAG: hypothetical protein JWQ88_3492, partial [Rhodoferax sp.]|nr:hypothetical protein [Rhodoferax sp.]
MAIRHAKESDLRRNFNSSTLVRLLDEWSGSESERPRQDLAERLSAWVGVFDAVTLHATHQSIGAAGSVRASAPSPSPSVPSAPLAKALDAQLQQVR